jgi:hypothetical protein
VSERRHRKPEAQQVRCEHEASRAADGGEAERCALIAA